MLFNSYSFIFIFLPIVASGFFILLKSSRNFAVVWLAVASLVFYGWWSRKFLLLLLISIIFNYTAGASIRGASENPRTTWSLLLVSVAVTANLLLLVYFKYANFFAASISNVTGIPIGILNITLPIGISFFTFTQIAYLIDVYKSKVDEYSFSRYLLFVTYFPHLVAGPILHHKEMIPQFGRVGGIKLVLIAAGISIFFAGLFKKVVLADGLSSYADSVFTVAEQSKELPSINAWVGVLAYTLQLYLDFSGYSDMAIGLSLLFGIRLPANFLSPYKATNIIDFWRRWHITLSRFLRDYLYIPLGGSRLGTARRYANLMITMLLGGLWHGAGWNFVIWGGLHGLYLGINHFWRLLRARILGDDRRYGNVAGVWPARFITFFAVTIAWVFFRAPSFNGAINILNAMFGLNVVSSPSHEFNLYIAIPHIATLLAFVWFLPNTFEIFKRYRPALIHRSADHFSYVNTSDGNPLPITWKPTIKWALVAGMAGAVSLVQMGKGQTVFLYFQF